jgi:nitroreductase/SAM-dependent methyltransferase
MNATTLPVGTTTPSRPAMDAEAVLAWIEKRFSCREFDDVVIDPAVVEAIIESGLQAPSSCNQQNWHFIAISDPALKKRAREISGGNHHFEFCSVLIYLCFQKGWTHDKFSVVQSVAAAAYHMMINAHLRGLASIWNAGIGDPKAISKMLGVPPTFEIQGALCIGVPKRTAPAMKAPRRPRGEVWSWNRFERPGQAIYPAKPAQEYPFFRISNGNNPYAEWRPRVWGWDRIADFRGYSVWAKSPIAGVYRSRRQGDATAVEIGLLDHVPPGSRVLDVMPWGGTHTTDLIRRLGPDVHVDVAELAEQNLSFIQERLRQEGVTQPVGRVLMKAGEVPVATGSVDAVTLFQVLEHAPEPEKLLDEVRRVLKPGGQAVISVRNLTSLYGWRYLRSEAKASVPNQGPFVPIAAGKVHAMVTRRFRIEREIGISLQAEGSAAVYEGRLARRICRLFALRVVKS